MNFCKFYLGDYLRSTGHLSLAENGALMLMLINQYATESPLPSGRALYRLLRSEGKADKAAIDSVTARFFTQTEDGLINLRAMDEIQQARHRAAINQAVGMKGGRPRKRNPEITQTVIETEPTDNPNQKPETRNQKPDGNDDDDRDASTRAKAVVVGGAAGDILQTLRANGAEVLETDARLGLWVRQGISTLAILQAIETAKENRRRSGSNQPIGISYLDAILRNIAGQPGGAAPSGRAARIDSYTASAAASRGDFKGGHDAIDSTAIRLA